MSSALPEADTKALLARLDDSRRLTLALEVRALIAKADAPEVVVGWPCPALGCTARHSHDEALHQALLTVLDKLMESLR